MPSGRKPLSEPKYTQLYVTICLTWPQWSVQSFFVENNEPFMPHICGVTPDLAAYVKIGMSMSHISKYEANYPIKTVFRVMAIRRC